MDEEIEVSEKSKDGRYLLMEKLSQDFGFTVEQVGKLLVERLNGINYFLYKIRRISGYSTNEIKQVIDDLCTKTGNSINYEADWVFGKYLIGEDPVKAWRESKNE